MEDQELSATCESHTNGEPPPSVGVVRVLLDDETFKAVGEDPLDAAISSTFQPGPTMLQPRWLSLCQPCLEGYMSRRRRRHQPRGRLARDRRPDACPT